MAEPEICSDSNLEVIYAADAAEPERLKVACSVVEVLAAFVASHLNSFHLEAHLHIVL